MITDRSKLSQVGLALLRKNLDKLAPPRSIELKIRGEQQVVIVYGPYEVFESNSFGWGRDDERTRALSEAVKSLGWSLPFDELTNLEPDKDQLINRW